jgi:monoamine oxidase
MLAHRQPDGKGRTMDVDVAIVGAGAAGIAAARRLRALGISHVLLEAATRAGGRAWTRRLATGLFDAGASWLHDSERNPLVPLAAGAGVALREAFGRRRRVRMGRSWATADDLAALDRASTLFDATARASAPLADMPLADAVAGLDDPWLPTVLYFESCLIAAADPALLSAHDWRDNELLGTNKLPEGGVGALLARLAPKGIVLRAQVTRIHGRGPVALETDAGRIRAQVAIVTVSTGVLRAGTIRFSPALPARWQSALHDLPMGLLSKIVLTPHGGARLPLTAGSVVRRQLPPREPGMFFHLGALGARHVVGFFGGQAAWDATDPRAAEEFARAEWRCVFGARADAVFTRATPTAWGTDPNFLGAYAYAVPGGTPARATLAQPEDGLILAGEALRTDGLAGTVGGAWLSGEDAAEHAARVVRHR